MPILSSVVAPFRLVPEALIAAPIERQQLRCRHAPWAATLIHHTQNPPAPGAKRF